MDKVFWEVHSGLPQEAPGSDEATAKAIAMVGGLPLDPMILDIGYMLKNHCRHLQSYFRFPLTYQKLCQALQQ